MDYPRRPFSHHNALRHAPRSPLTPFHIVSPCHLLSLFTSRRAPPRTPAHLSSPKRVADDEAFGAHTDTSFVTIGLRAARPGLQVLPLDALSHPDSDSDRRRRRRRQWVDVEETLDDDRASPAPPTGPVAVVAVVLVGECLQVLTGGHFRAAPHRVVAGLPTHNSSSGTSSGGRSGGRVSCPFIVRGRPDAVVGLRDPRRGYHHTCAPGTSLSPPPHPGRFKICPYLTSHHRAELLEESEPSPDEGSEDRARRPFRLPNLDGSSMRFLNRLLEMKRRRCARAHADLHVDTTGADGSGAGPGTDWILCAYPMMEPAAAADSSSRREGVEGGSV